MVLVGVEGSSQQVEVWFAEGLAAALRCFMFI